MTIAVEWKLNAVTMKMSHENYVETVSFVNLQQVFF